MKKNEIKKTKKRKIETNYENDLTERKNAIDYNKRKHSLRISIDKKHLFIHWVPMEKKDYHKQLVESLKRENKNN